MSKLPDRGADSPTCALLPGALWKKSLLEARLLLAALAAMIFTFNVLYVWLSSQVELGALAIFLKALPESFEQAIGVPFDSVATPTGRMAMAYVDPVWIFVATAWSIARGSDCISGEIGRGTMEMLLAQSIRRWAIIVVHAVVTAAGAGVLVVAGWLGMGLGVRITRFAPDVDMTVFVPSTLNLFAFIFFLTALSTLVSACGSDRRRTIGIVAGFYLVQLMMKIVARTVPRLHWLMYATFLGAFEPQALAVERHSAWQELAWRNGCLIGLGLVAYMAAVGIFARRDLPAPL